MRVKPESCRGCACEGHGSDFSEVEGRGTLGVLVVAEASGEHEQREQLPLRPFAPAGSLFERSIRRLGFSREQFAITNVLRCRPKNNLLEGMPWQYSAISQCSPNLDAVVEKFRPRVILALGGTALEAITGEAGKARGVSHLRGYVLQSRFPGVLCLPTYHPSYIRRGAAQLTGVFMRDIYRAVAIAQGKDKSYLFPETGAAFTDDDCKITCPGLKYYEHPSLELAQGLFRFLRDNPRIDFAYDLETVETPDLDEDAREQFADTTIRTFQVSWAPGEGVSFPYTNGYRKVISDILQLENQKIGHNAWLFDDKVLAAVQEREGLPLIPKGKSHDTLQMFHHWQPDLPAHLQYASSFVQFPFPWKHLSSTNLEFYGIADVDATLRLYREAQKTMDKRGILVGYQDYIYAVRPVLARMEQRGLPVDDRERLRLDVEFGKAQAEILAELDAAFPDECRRGKQKEGYKKTPKVIAEWMARKFHEGFIPPSGMVVKITEEEVYQLRAFEEAGLDAQGEPTVTKLQRWAKIEPFSPNSGQQLVKYMKAKHHPVPKDLKKLEAGGTGETTAKKELERLAGKTGDKFYLRVIECREFGKMRGTYIEGFKPLADGAVHTTLTFDTATWQLASKNPNIQNFPKHGRLAKLARKMIAARPGKTMLELDFKSFHVLTTGYFAESERYMRLARLDMHSFIAGHFLKCWDAHKLFDEPDEELRVKFKWFKSDERRKQVRDKKAKPTILGVGFGLGVKKLFDMNRESFTGQKEAQQFRDVLEQLFPEVFQWQERIKQLAHDQTYLKSPFGAIRWFYDVFQWSSAQRKWVNGEQAEQALAFLPANSAFGHIRACLLELDRTGAARRFGLCNTIHDSVVFECPDESVEECKASVYDILTAPSKVLIHPRLAPGGLAVDVDCSVGKNWAEMVEVPVGRKVLGQVTPAEVAEAATIPVSQMKENQCNLDAGIS